MYEVKNLSGTKNAIVRSIYTKNKSIDRHPNEFNPDSRTTRAIVRNDQVEVKSTEENRETRPWNNNRCSMRFGKTERVNAWVFCTVEATQ